MEDNIEQERDLYSIMTDIKESTNSSDIKYIGTAQVKVKDNIDTDVTISKDVFVVSDEEDNHISARYYDENGNLLGTKLLDGTLIPSNDLILEVGEEEAIGFLSEIENMELEAQENLSLNEVNKKAGINKDKVRSVTTADDQEMDNDKLELGEDEEDELSEEKDEKEQDEHNKNALDKINTKQETNLDKKFNDKYTLADVLGVERGCKLIAVYSDAIKGNKNTTRYSFIIQKPDGSLEPADMLEQVGGKDSDKTVYETNHDGSEVEKKSVNSSYSVKSPLGKNIILTAKNEGRVELSLGFTDPTSHKDAVTQELNTRQNYPVTERVRDAFNMNKGVYHAEEMHDEIAAHDDHDCKTNINDLDGNDRTTSHQYHSENHTLTEQENNLAERIRDEASLSEDFRDTLTNEQIYDMYMALSEANKGRSAEDIEKMTVYMLENEETKSHNESENEEDVEFERGHRH